MSAKLTYSETNTAETHDDMDRTLKFSVELRTIGQTDFLWPLSETLMTRTIYRLTALLCVVSGNQQPEPPAPPIRALSPRSTISLSPVDIDQRLRLLEIMGNKQSGDGIRKKALDMMIDEIIKIAEAKKCKVRPPTRKLTPTAARGQPHHRSAGECAANPGTGIAISS
jgi:hypothetical protein